MIFSNDMLVLYAITDRGNDSKEELYSKVKKALDGGITMLQLREKNLAQDEFIEEAIALRELCHSYNVPLIINDNVEVAIKSGADGVHVGIEDAPVSEIRKKVKNNFIIGATAKTVEQAKSAMSSGADYLGVGAVFPSPTKTNVIRITNEMLNEICDSVDIPSVAIGGINLDNLSELKGSKIDGIAVVSAIFSAENIEDVTTKLKRKVINEVLNK